MIFCGKSIFIVKTEDNEKYKFRLYGDGDPGYKSTARFICESALCLACNEDELPNGSNGGVLTSASGLGDILIKRLKNAGILFEGPERI